MFLFNLSTKCPEIAEVAENDDGSLYPDSPMALNIAPNGFLENTEPNVGTKVDDALAPNGFMLSIVLYFETPKYLVKEGTAKEKGALTLVCNSEFLAEEKGFKRFFRTLLLRNASNVLDKDEVRFSFTVLLPE
jgi:hypothetical protein